MTDDKVTISLHNGYVQLYYSYKWIHEFLMEHLFILTLR